MSSAIVVAVVSGASGVILVLVVISGVVLTFVVPPFSSVALFAVVFIVFFSGLLVVLVSVAVTSTPVAILVVVTIGRWLRCRRTSPVVVQCAWSRGSCRWTSWKRSYHVPEAFPEVVCPENTMGLSLTFLVGCLLLPLALLDRLFFSSS